MDEEAPAPAPTPSLEDVQTLLRPDRADRANRLSGITPGESNSEEEEEEEPELAAIEDGRATEAALIAEGERRLAEEEPQSPQPPALTNLDVLLRIKERGKYMDILHFDEMVCDPVDEKLQRRHEWIIETLYRGIYPLPGAHQASREWRLPDSPTPLESFVSIPQIRSRIMYAGIWDSDKDEEPVVRIRKMNPSSIERLENIDRAFCLLQ